MNTLVHVMQSMGTSVKCIAHFCRMDLFPGGQRACSIKTHNAWAYERIIICMQWKAHSTCDWINLTLPALQLWHLQDVLQDNHLQDAEVVIRTTDEAPADTKRHLATCFPLSRKSLSQSSAICGCINLSPDIDVGLGKCGEHCGGYTLSGRHLMPNSSQDAAVVDLFHLADATGLNSVQKPANKS